MKKSLLSIILIITLFTATICPIYADVLTENNTTDLRADNVRIRSNEYDIKYYQAVYSVLNNKDINAELQEELIKELSNRHQYLINQTTFSTRDATYKYIGKTTTSVRDIKRFDGYVNFSSSISNLIGLAKGSQPAQFISGVLWVIAAGRYIKWSKFNDELIFEEKRYIKWENAYDYTLKFVRSFWYENTILDAFNGQYYDTVYYEQIGID